MALLHIKSSLLSQSEGEAENASLTHTPTPPSLREPLEHVKPIYSNALVENFGH